MHRIVVLYPHPTDPDHFREHYVTHHLPLAAKLPGLLGFRYSMDLSGGEAESPYFAYFEADFADGEAVHRALTSPEGGAALADLPNYATGGSIPLIFPVTEGKPEA